MDSIALAAGADRAAKMPGAALKYYPEFPAICQGNACGYYGANHACPPGCGDAELLFDRIVNDGFLILFQKDYPVDGDFDICGMQRAAKSFGRLCRNIKKLYINAGFSAVVFGAGPCLMCGSCAYPNSCPQPQNIVYPLEAAGINVQEACRAIGLPYNAAGNTVTYSGILKVKRERGIPVCNAYV